MSVKPPKAEVARRRWHFRYVPFADLSSGGARLEFVADTIGETDFVLFIPTHNIALNCKRIWRRKQAMGIQFERGRPDLAALAEAHSELAG